MRCDDARLALSARLDGEPLPNAVAGASDGAALDGHLEGCATCRAWLAGAERVTRLVRVQPVRVPDLTAQIMQALQADGTLGSPKSVGKGHRYAGGRAVRLLGAWLDGSRAMAAVRWALGGLAVVQLMLAVPDLLGAVGHDAHAGREVAAFDIALAVGLLVVAFYPEHARVFAPVAGALVFCFAAISALDMMQGVVTPGRVAIHGIAALQALLVWRLARTNRVGVGPPPVVA